MDAFRRVAARVRAARPPARPPDTVAGGARDDPVKLLIILLVMLALAAGALHSWRERGLYLEASLYAEGFSLTAQPKLRIADRYAATGRMPNDNDAAGLPPPRRLYGTSVRRIAVNRGGVLAVDFDDEIGRAAMTFTPDVDAASGLLTWRCSSDSIDPDVLDKLEQPCSWLLATDASRLVNAIANRDPTRVRELLAGGADPNRVVTGNTPLMLAAKVGDRAAVETLLDAGAAIDNTALNAERRTPLMVAIAADRGDIAGLLLARGASVTARDHQGMDALDHAEATDARLGGRRYTLMVAARHNPRFAGGGRPAAGRAATPEQRRTRLAALYGELRRAATDCHVKRLATLFAEEGDLDAPELVGGEPLGSLIRKPACRYALIGHLAAKPSYRLARAARFAAAVRACDRRETETMLADDPELDVFDAFEGVTHLDRAVAAGCTDIVALFVRERDVQGKLAEGALLDAVREAPQRSLVPIVGALLAAGADVGHRDADGETPLSLAIASEQPVVAKLLVDAGADVDAPTATGSVALVEATKRGYAHLVEQLVAAGAALDSRDALGRTALLAAVARDDSRTVDVLVRAGADPRLRDENGLDALVLADSKRLRRIRTLLTTASAEDF